MSAARDAYKVLRFVWTHPANRHARWRGLGRAVGFQVRGRLGRPTLTPIGSRSRMWVELHHAGASKVLYANPPDWAEMMAWRRLLRPGDLFVDVGSNVGAYALWAAESGAEVIAVEPDPGSARRLRANVALNLARVEVLECALAERTGRMALTSGRDTTNHLVFDCDGPTTMVDVRTLDDVIGERRVAGVKIDVEGAERLVLAGARRALAERRIAAIQLEWNRQSEAVLGETRAPLEKLLRDHGYGFLRPDRHGALRPTDCTSYGDDLFALPGV